MQDTTKPIAHFDATASAVLVEQLTIRDADVVREAQRWTTGERGHLVEDVGMLGRADLGNFATEAMRIGAHALSITGQAQESRALERMLKEVGETTANGAAGAAEVTKRAAREASEAVAKAAGDAKKAITEADARNREELTTAVAAAKRELQDEVSRVFGGKEPELLKRLGPLLDRFGADLDKKATAGTSELLAKAAKQFDPTDSSSPMAKHSAELGRRQQELANQLTRSHDALAAKVDELATALRVQEARTALAKVTPIKGDSYAAQLHAVLHGIAAGLGDEYADTGTVVGLLPRCKKGDGVLTVDGGAAHVVLEMTDSPRTGWSGYLDEAERNRDATASLGLVRTAEQNGGQTVHVIGNRRVVMAFDPDRDDPDLLRTVVILLRTAAVAACSRRGAHQIATAEEKIREAVEQLGAVDSVKKLAGTIQKSATRIDSECSGLNSGIRRLLDEALGALAGTDSVEHPAVDGAA